MPGYRVLLLQVDRASVQLRLHRLKRFLDAPEPVVGRIDRLGVHVGLRGDDRVVAGAAPGLLDLAGNLSELLAGEPGVIGHGPFLLERDLFLLAVLARDLVGEITDDGLEAFIR